MPSRGRLGSGVIGWGATVVPFHESILRFKNAVLPCRRQKMPIESGFEPKLASWLVDLVELDGSRRREDVLSLQLRTLPK